MTANGRLIMTQPSPTTKRVTGLFRVSRRVSLSVAHMLLYERRIRCVSIIGHEYTEDNELFTVEVATPEMLARMCSWCHGIVEDDTDVLYASYASMEEMESKWQKGDKLKPPQ